MRLRPIRTPEDFWSATTSDGACVVWARRLDKDGYGRLTYNGQRVLVHRLAFFLTHGRWPVGLLRHLCGNNACVLHTVEGTQSENMLDRRRHGTDHNVNKTECPRGHPYDEANTGTERRQTGVGRYCRACKRERSRARRARAHATV